MVHGVADALVTLLTQRRGLNKQDSSQENEVGSAYQRAMSGPRQKWRGNALRVMNGSHDIATLSWVVLGARYAESQEHTTQIHECEASILFTPWKLHL